MFDVILSPEARVFYDEADQPLARKLARCFAQLEHDPRRHNNIKRLSGKLAGRFRYRIGDWRVVYRIDDRARQVPAEEHDRFLEALDEIERDSKETARS